MMMKDEDDDYLDDPILLLDFNHSQCGHNLYIEDLITIEDDGVKDIQFQINQKDFDRYISSSEKDVSILPVPFYVIRKNVELLNTCRPISIKLTDCLQYLKRNKNCVSNYFYSNNLQYSVNVQNIEMTETGNKILTPCKKGNCISISLSFGRKYHKESKNTTPCLSLSRAIPHFHDVRKNKFLLGNKVCDQGSKFERKMKLIDKNNTSCKIGKIHKDKRPKRKLQLNSNITGPAHISQNWGETTKNQIKTKYQKGNSNQSSLHPVALFADESSSRLISETISSLSKSLDKNVESRAISVFKKSMPLNRNEIQKKYFYDSVTNAAPLLISTANYFSDSYSSNTNHISYNQEKASLCINKYGKIRKIQQKTDQHHVVPHNQNSMLNIENVDFAQSSSSPKLTHDSLRQLYFDSTGEFNKRVNNLNNNRGNNLKKKDISIHNKIHKTILGRNPTAQKNMFQSSLSLNSALFSNDIDTSKVSKCNYTKLKNILESPSLTQITNTPNATNTNLKNKMTSLGYSPPILPIPTYQNTFNLLSQINLTSDILNEDKGSGSAAVDLLYDQERFLLNRRISYDIEQLADRVEASYNSNI